MEKLDKKYSDQLDAIKEEIQNSEILGRYLEEEEDEIYKELQEEFEPKIEEVHKEVADLYPLQIVSLEQKLLDDGFEGLFLPRVLGYAVLRGGIDSNYKYTRPQKHFKEVLLAISNNANFAQLKNRIGESIQIGFALSSDIWITNLLNEIKNKRVYNFLTDQKKDKYRDIRDRHTAYVKYARQFKNFNFQSAEFPSNKLELKSYAEGLKNLVAYRSKGNYNNASLMPHIQSLIGNEEYKSEKEYAELIVLIAMSLDLDDATKKMVKENLALLRKNNSSFDNDYFDILEQYLQDDYYAIGASHDKRMSDLLDKSGNDEISQYYKLMDQVHGLGYIHEDAIEAVRNYYDQHQGLSVQNRCVRMIIFSYFETFLGNLEVTDYQEYMEINKVFVAYMNIFSNEKFNQKVKNLSMRYIKKLLKHYTDKRGRDYQDIKKFVSATFLDLGFLKQKEIVELFKTKRKKAPVKA